MKQSMSSWRGTTYIEKTWCKRRWLDAEQIYEAKWNCQNPLWFANFLCIKSSPVNKVTANDFWKKYFSIFPYIRLSWSFVNDSDLRGAVNKKKFHNEWQYISSKTILIDIKNVNESERTVSWNWFFGNNIFYQKVNNVFDNPEAECISKV